MKTEIPKDLFLIGKVHSSQGVRGSLFVILQTEDPQWLGEWNTLYLTGRPENRDFKSYKIARKHSHHKQGKSGFIVDLEEIKDKDAADELVHCAVWVPNEFVASKKGETIYLREILNFQVVDETRGEVGPVVGFASNGPQDLLQIDYKGTVYDVPFVKAFLKNIDFKTQKISMDIPLGLLGEE